MPHVVLEGAVDLQRLSEHFEPVLERWGDDLLKIQRLYMKQQGEEVLLDMLVVESGHQQRFFIQLTRREGGAMLRLLPQTDPEKTDGVKRALARAAALVREHTEGECRYGATNLSEFLG